MDMSSVGTLLNEELTFECLQSYSQAASATIDFNKQEFIFTLKQTKTSVVNIRQSRNHFGLV